MMKREHPEERPYLPPHLRPAARRSCTPAILPNETSSNANVQEPISATMAEALVDIRLIKYSLLEVQDPVKELFSRIEALTAERTSLPDSSSSPLNILPKEAAESVGGNGTDKGHSKTTDATPQQNLEMVDQATSLPVPEYKIELPFSQRPYNTSSIPLFPKESLLLLPFVTTLQQLQKSKNIKSIDIGEINAKVSRLDPAFMDHLKAKSFEHYVVKAQKWLDLVIDDAAVARICFRDPEQPWLTVQRKGIPSWEEQRKEVIDFLRLPEAAIERFYPLIEALLEIREGPGWVGFTRLKTDLIARDCKRFESMAQSDWTEYYHDAVKVCNIQITGRANSVDNVRILDARIPFRFQRFNNFYFTSKAIRVVNEIPMQPRQHRVDARGDSDASLVKKRRLDT